MLSQLLTSTETSKKRMQYNCDRSCFSRDTCLVWTDAKTPNSSLDRHPDSNKILSLSTNTNSHCWMQQGLLSNNIIIFFKQYLVTWCFIVLHSCLNSIGFESLFFLCQRVSLAALPKTQEVSGLLYSRHDRRLIIKITHLGKASNQMKGTA